LRLPSVKGTPVILAESKEFMMSESSVRFDMFAWQVVPWSVMRDDVRYLETLNIGTVWLGDAYAMPLGHGGAVLEAWTTLGALAACTERVRLGTMVSNVSLRHPATPRSVPPICSALPIVYSLRLTGADG
jgi:Luciferase-like monooxygenase